jgi:hypothetical protein
MRSVARGPRSPHLLERPVAGGAEFEEAFPRVSRCNRCGGDGSAASDALTGGAAGSVDRGLAAGSGRAV